MIPQTVLFLLFGGLVFRVLIALFLLPGFDEAYYYIYTLNLDWSYFDHPVLVALITGFGPWLTGVVSQFTIRLGSLILYTISLLFLYQIGTKLFSPQAGKWIVAIATLVPIFQVGFGVLTLPDSPLIFFWSASLYCATLEFFSTSKEYRPSYRLAALGILLGLTCLGKYHGFILCLGFVGFCLTSSRHRRALFSPWFFLSLGLFFLTLFPLLFWNLNHDWVSFSFQLSRGVAKTSYNPLNAILVLLISVAYLFPTLGFPFLWVGGKSLVQTGKNIFFGQKIDERKVFILWMSLPLILGFTFIGGYQQILPTWMMPGFWGLTLLLGQQVSLWEQQFSVGIKRWFKGSAIAIISLIIFALLHLNLGTLQTTSQYALFGGFLEPQQDASTQLIDIKQLRQGFLKDSHLNSALSEADFLFTNSFFTAGYIAMALHPINPIPITCFCEDTRGFDFWSEPEQWLNLNGLYLTLESLGNRTDYSPYFESLEEIGTVPIQRGGGTIEIFQIYQAKNMISSPFLDSIS